MVSLCSLGWSSLCNPGSRRRSCLCLLSAGCAAPRRAETRCSEREFYYIYIFIQCVSALACYKASVGLIEISTLIHSVGPGNPTDVSGMETFFLRAILPSPRDRNFRFNVCFNFVVFCSLLFLFLFYLVSCFETGSHSVTQAGLKPIILTVLLRLALKLTKNPPASASHVLGF